ncbi:E3 ubiquitin-protein ligase UBR2-like isoform X2 [Babylonia areolata]|uniref:E3 ubiquitin-protein ligase UBR2-like isoform X2 n=1 Tax=Babylonia areolata TaxID=304850 RepID=UPI003FD4EE45
MAQSNKAFLAQMPSFSEDTILQEWSSALAAQDLEQTLHSHWSKFVPIVFACGHIAEKEQRYSTTFLFHPLEKFLCGGEPALRFQELKDLDAPSQICGNVFRPGEPTYSCRDCANDPTCVLCINCFQRSQHKNHKYRMSTSGGGGYCDCGDPEAWKTEPVCEAHRAAGAQGASRDPVENLPVDLRERARLIFRTVLTFIVDLLTWDKGDVLPDCVHHQGELTDTYHCMLFNDEVHTYDQVITTLQRAIECTLRQATDFATIVDREGRSSVRQGAAAFCEKAKEVIERTTSRHGSRALKVMVMHNILVAHQTFALRCIEWLQSVVNKTDGLRRLFFLMSMQEVEGQRSLMERLILADTQLWKVARTMSHELLMSGVLKDPECKKQFAVIFTKHYPQMVEDFIHDDHDHDVSVVSLSVQVYTVPSLARMLIAEHDLISVILKPFIKTCQRKQNDKGKLSFDRNDRSANFKRASYMLYDLKYALLCKPSDSSEWTDELRSSFLKGFHTMLTLLRMMQGMDLVCRQTLQHLEFEPEWEGAFNLQLKLEDSLVLLADWCASDRFLLIEAYKETLDILYQCREKADREKQTEQDDSQPEPYLTQTVEGHTAKCVKYNVSSQPVSIHLPISRFLASLYIHLENYGLMFESPELKVSKRQEMVELIEPALRVQVLIAQTQAGMWRRNGFSLLNQIYFYHNVRCREEMYNKDIIMLQIAASLLNPNEFLIHILNKFGLVSWTRVDYDTPTTGQEDSVRQTVTLAEEFLTLLIVLLEERYVPGIGEVTQKDAVKREIIHQLCISPMPHSKLAKALPEDPNHETGLEGVVEEVAVFKKTGPRGNGQYELKEKYYAEYCPFFYHYSKSDQSKAEEAERSRKKQNGDDQALPPPVPPPFKPAFQPVVQLMCSDIMMHLFSTILDRTAASRSRSWSEAQFERVLYLIGLGLHEQSAALRSGDTSFTFLQRCMGEGGVLKQLEALVHHPNVKEDPIKDLLAWVLRKFGEVMQLCDEPSCKDQLDSLAKCADLRSQSERKKKAAIAAKRRAKVMAQMSKMQKNFIAENAELFESTRTEVGSGATDMELSEASPDSVALGPGQSESKVSTVLTVTCILCQEEESVTNTSRTMLLAAFVQMSTVLSQNRDKHLTNGEQYDPLLMSADLFNGTHTSSCGHCMHHECWQRFFQNIVNKERRRPIRFRQNSSYDVDKMEYLCPLCEGLSNTVIPIIPHLSTLQRDGENKAVVLEFDDWLDGIHKTAINSVQNKENKGDFFLTLQPCPVSTITRMMADSVARNFQLLWEYVLDESSGDLSDGMKEMMQKFAKDVYVFGLGVKPDDDNPRVPVMSWNTCAFTIMSFEQDLSGENQGIFGSLTERQSFLLGSLVRFAATISHFVSTDIMREHCVKLLSLLIPEKVESLVYEAECFLDVDLVHFLVALTMTLPALHTGATATGTSTATATATTMLPSGGLNDQHALRLVFILHLVQVMLTYDAPPQESMEMEEEAEGEGTALLEIYKSLRSDAGLQCTEMPSCWQLLSHVREATLPFLRCAALFYHYLTGVVAPVSLHERGSNEFSHLCNYLALPKDMSTLFTAQHTQAMVKSWCCSRTVRERLSASGARLMKYPRPTHRLIPLPADYSELINEASQFKCPKSEGDDSRAPTRCLVCGVMLCSQSYCCQTDIDGTTVGAATQHACSCGAGTGIFLRVRDCQILLLSGKTKGCFLPAPYVDSYGESDQGLRRGNPLTLCPDQYSLINKIWSGHNITQTIARYMNQDTTNGFLSIEWNHL